MKLSGNNSMKFETPLSVDCDWFDTVSRTTRKLKLNFYLPDNSIEMFELPSKKLFLKRMYYKDIHLNDLYVGNVVVVLSRQLRIMSYGDDFTVREMSRLRQRTFAMIKPDGVPRAGEIISDIQAKGFEVTSLRMVNLSRGQTIEFYQEHKGRGFFEDLIIYITSGPVIALELVGKEAIENWRKNLGPTDSNQARQMDPETIRAKFGKDKQKNAAHGSESANAASRELEFFFGANSAVKLEPACRLGSTTCCVIKPHALKAGNLGRILSIIKEGGFEVTGMQMFRIGRNQAEEFLEVYNGVLIYYPELVQQLSSGPLVALEIATESGVSAAEAFRDFVGPMDPEVARELRPGSLRAKFGEDKVRNAVHCSDLPEDGPLEVEYFFKILQQK